MTLEEFRAKFPEEYKWMTENAEREGLLFEVKNTLKAFIKHENDMKKNVAFQECKNALYEWDI